MRIVTPKQMNEIDQAAIKEIGIPGIVLMENAAIRVVEEIEKDLKSIKLKSILVFAGKGNNGGDAFAVARHLLNKGARLKVFILAERKSISHDAAANLNIIENMGLVVMEATADEQINEIQKEIQNADLLIDGIFGTGIKGEVQGNAKKLIDIINKSGKPVVSIDIPSGVCGSTGKIMGSCIKAYKTVTFQLPKIGLAVHPGSEFAGELIVADIGIPSKVLENTGINTFILDKEYVSCLIPGRALNSNKGDYGRIFIISGSAGMTGAGVLSARAALRTGAGLVYLGVPSLLVPVYDAALIEAVTIPLEDEGNGVLSKNSLNQIKEKLGKMSVIAVGPGLSTHQSIYDIVSGIVSSSEVPLILDADALNVLSKDISLLSNLKADAVLTPHPGEMSRLTGISTSEVQNNRVEVAREFACKWKVTLVLKGSKTVVAFPDGEIFINTTGNSGLATAGAGDVLTGIIAGLIGQGLSVCDAAAAGVYLHGLAGDNAADIKGEHGLIAGDIIEELPLTIKKLIINS